MNRGAKRAAKAAKRRKMLRRREPALAADLRWLQRWEMLQTSVLWRQPWVTPINAVSNEDFRLWDHRLEKHRLLKPWAYQAGM